ncbi:pyridoxamine 5'-phosphate oxidase family protein [Paenibacillus polymyxa]|uniref:pyridoxamine 5'-phosphate oxidase family protein n=1 Tax=Paenibacillus polymyxa TaxID=1406 RepID=UPI002ED3F53B|nr:pyridoxamine 5'-phosphate oxidase family protein [Paenibacillus polymyxa]
MEKKTESAIEAGIREAQKLRDNGLIRIDLETGISNAQRLLERSEIAMVGSVDLNGFPHTKAMFIRKSERLETVWFGTHLSTKRVSQFTQNPKASLYFFDKNSGEGLLLVGEIEVLQDMKSKESLWREGWQAYYPLGALDPNYGILKFIAQSGNYYKELQSIEFDL